MVSVQSTVSTIAIPDMARCTVLYYSTVAVMQPVTWSSGYRVCDSTV